MKDFEIASKRIRFMFLVTVIHANNINMTIMFCIFLSVNAYGEGRNNRK